MYGFNAFLFLFFDITDMYNQPESGCEFLMIPLVHKGVMSMSTMEVLTLLLVIFAALSFLDNHKKISIRPAKSNA